LKEKNKDLEKKVEEAKIGVDNVSNGTGKSDKRSDKSEKYEK
jgi:hypothetical protein